jgi:Hemopexin
MAKAYLIKGDSYVRFDTDANSVDAGYPKPISGGWGGLAEAGFGTPDTALDLGNGRLYVFKGDQYVRVDNGRNSMDDGYPKPIAGQWAGMAEVGFGDSLDAAVNWGNGKVYFFRGDQYLRYDIAADKVDDGYPQSIAQFWPGLGDVGFGDGLDSVVNWTNGKVYFFRGDQYLRYDLAGNAADGGYPQPIAGNWAGLGEAGFGDGLNAVWIRLAAAGSSGPAPVSGSASSGDDHGGWVRLPDELRVGGTLAWRNNNPGNLLPGRVPYKTALAVDRRGLAIFPTYDHGWTALREVLRSNTYGPLTIADAMAKYAPTGHGNNDPALYASLIRKNAGLEPSRVVNTLSDDEMEKFMLAIKQVEGFKEGTAYARGDATIPADLAPLLN